METIFPNGIVHYLVGGLLIGAGIGLAYLLTGRRAGVSGVLTAAQSWWSRRPGFHTPHVLDERRWKGTLVVGIVIGAALVTLLGPFVAADVGGPFVTEVQWWRLGFGGLLVGLGTRAAVGCTSGHGICGMSAFAPASISATVIFMVVAIVTAQIVLAAGVRP